MPIDDIRDLVPFGEIDKELEHSRRSDAEHERDLPVIASMYVRGAPISKILEHVNSQYPTERQMTSGVIRYDIRTIRKLWLESALVDFNSMKSKELARLDEVEKELWDAWERSKETYIKHEATEHHGQVPLRSGDVVDVENITTKRIEETPVGDLKIMQAIINVIDMRCKLLGLMEAQRYIVDWRTEARSTGLSEKEVETVYETVVDRFVEAIKRAEADNTPIEAAFREGEGHDYEN